MPFSVQWDQSTLAALTVELDEDNTGAANGIANGEGMLTPFIDVSDYDLVEFFLTTKAGAAAPTAGAPLEIYAVYADDGTVGTRHVDADTQFAYDASLAANLTAANAALARAQLDAPVKTVTFTAVSAQVRDVSFVVPVEGRRFMALFFFNGVGQALSTTDADHILRWTGHRRRIVAV